MKYVLTGEEAQVLDKATQESFHMDDLVLMERAALSLSDEIKKRFSKDEKILFICGTGNNGADGVASARILFNQGYLNVSLCLALGKEKPCKGSFRSPRLTMSLFQTILQIWKASMSS